MKKVFCFGVFDGIHDGHRHMLKQARLYGDYIIVALTQDHIVEKLKNKKPRNSLITRIQALKDTNFADEVIAGDDEIMTWKNLHHYKPNVIALGYDQERLKKVLEAEVIHFPFSTQIVVLPALEPDKLHSSLLFKTED